MLKLLTKKNTLQYDIIATQKSWKNNQYNNIYNSTFDRFKLLYYDKKTTRICFYINKDIIFFSWNVTHHTTNYSILKLKTSNVKTINVYNLYNFNVSTTKTNKSIMQLKKRFEKFSHEEHIALKNFNLHHAIWKKVDVSKKDKTSKILIEIAKTHEMKQLLTSKTMMYSNKKSNNIINLCIRLSFCWSKIALIAKRCLIYIFRIIIQLKSFSI